MGRITHLAVLLLLLFIGTSEACTTILVGKNATIDGSMIIARNEDGASAGEPKIMVRTDARKQSAQFISNSIFSSENNFFSVNMPPNALGYVAYPYWSTTNKHNKSLEETGINDYGV